MDTAQNIAAQEKFGAAVNSGRFEDFNDLVAAGCVDHDPAPGQEPGPQGYAHFFGMLRKAFPDLKLEVDKLIAADDIVSFAYTVTGTHQGDFMGVPPTGKAIRARGMQMSRFQNGKMVERWGSSDELGILKKLGAI